MLDVTSNEISTVHAFGKEINLSKVYLDYNQIDKIEKDVDGYYCGYYDGPFHLLVQPVERGTQYLQRRFQIYHRFGELLAQPDYGSRTEIATAVSIPATWTFRTIT